MTNEEIRKRITEKILNLLDNEIIPWEKPWNEGLHKNATNNKDYRGINQLLLQIAAIDNGFVSPYWLTYKQARSLSGHVKKGVEGTGIIFWKFVVIDDSESGTDEFGYSLTKKVPFMRYYTVFNVEQCYIPEEKKPAHLTPKKLSEAERIEEAERIVNECKDKPPIEHRPGSARAFYNPTKDIIVMPAFSGFNEGDGYYSTLFHELIHSTGYHKRLGRFPEKYTGANVLDYSKEELIAEFGAAFMCGYSGIKNEKLIKNQAAYIKGWKKFIQEDGNVVISATQAAQKACDWILNINVEEMRSKANEAIHTPQKPMDDRKGGDLLAN